MDWFTLFLLYCFISPIVVSTINGFLITEKYRLGYKAWKRACKELDDD